MFLGALGQRTTKPMGTGVTPVIHHYHPGHIAQAWMSLEELYPGRMFLGVGSGRTYPTWGQMIALGRDFVSVAWWLATFPGLAILATVLAINLVGDRLRDALDPRV